MRLHPPRRAMDPGGREDAGGDYDAPRDGGSGQLKRTNVRNERLVALALFGLLLFNYPLLQMFNAPTLVLGIPKLYLYLFVAWAVLISGAALVLRLSQSDDRDLSGEQRRARRPPPLR